MSTPDQANTATTPPEAPEWTQEDRDALFASAQWLGSKATPELIDPHRGKHVAVLGEQIIDSDRDRGALCHRITQQKGTLPIYRVLIRYIPTDEEAWSGSW